MSTKEFLEIVLIFHKRATCAYLFPTDKKVREEYLIASRGLTAAAMKMRESLNPEELIEINKLMKDVYGSLIL